MAHDPRAPRLAAVSTLTAGALLVLSAANLQFNAVGTPGITGEEMLAVLGAALAIVVAQFANKEHEIPELGQANRPISDIEEFGQTLTRTSTVISNEVNPTTASIISGILGTTDTGEQVEVASAISTLSSGDFGAAVAATVKEAGAAQERNANKREAQPADEVTGETLQRVLVQPVPLPGREEAPVRDPSTIPGLEPNRVFVRDGVDHVPLPHQTGAQPEDNHRQPSPTEADPVPDLGDLDRFLSEPPEDEGTEAMVPHLIEQEQNGSDFATTADSNLAPASPELPELPNLEAMLNDDDDVAETASTAALPDATGLTLPALDDLFADEVLDNATPPLKALPDLPDLDDLF